MQGESAANSGYHAENAAFGQTEDKMSEATIGALTNLATATSTYRGDVATLTEANSRLAKQLEDHSNDLKDIEEILKEKRADRKGHINFNPSPDNYFWTHGYKVATSHTSKICNYPKHSHKHKATKADNMGGANPTENDVQGRHL
jgi:hypothetical protein